MSAPRLFATEKISICFHDRRNKTHKRTIQGRCRFKSKIKERFRTKIKERCKKSKIKKRRKSKSFAFRSLPILLARGSLAANTVANKWGVSLPSAFCLLQMRSPPEKKTKWEAAGRWGNLTWRNQAYLRRKGVLIVRLPVRGEHL